jgi:hypothetical protein
MTDSIIDEGLIFGPPLFSEGLRAVAIYGFRDGFIDKVWFI